MPVWNFNPPTGWNLGINGYMVQRPDGHSLPDSWLMLPGGSQVSILLRPTTPDLVAGKLYQAWLYADLSNLAGPYLRAQYNDQYLAEDIYLFWDDVSVGFQFWFLGSFTATPWNQNFRLTLDSTEALGNCTVNELYVVESFEMARSRWLAHNALLTVLKTIQGGVGFHLNLGNRVYPRFVNPRQNNVSFPYVCVPLATDAPVVTDMQNLVKYEWTLHVYGFVGEQDSAENNTTTVRDALYLGEDIIQAILLNRTLGDTCQGVEIMGGGESIAGVDSEFWGEVRIPLKLTLYADKLDLKP